jgi:hypothetical protein
MDHSKCVRFVDFSPDFAMRDEGRPELDDGVTTGSLTKRDCFRVAAHTLLRCDYSDARLVHGRVHNRCSDGPKYVRHAWVETTGIGVYRDGSERPITIVIDYTQIDEHNRTLPRTLYYEAMGVRPLQKRYTFARVALLAARHEHYGPWDDELGNA